MLDCQLAILENAIARHTATGEVPGPLGSRHPSITPFDAFATADRPIVIAAGNDRLFAALCRALERPELARDRRFASNERRCRHQAALKAALEAALARRPAAEWLATLEAAGVPCGPIHTIPEALADPQVLARNMLVRLAGAAGAAGLKVAGNPIKLAGAPDPEVRPAAPELDADRAAILAELAAHEAAEGEE